MEHNSMLRPPEKERNAIHSQALQSEAPNILPCVIAEHWMLKKSFGSILYAAYLFVMSQD